MAKVHSYRRKNNDSANSIKLFENVAHEIFIQLGGWRKITNCPPDLIHLKGVKAKQN